MIILKIYVVLIQLITLGILVDSMIIENNMRDRYNIFWSILLCVVPTLIYIISN